MFEGGGGQTEVTNLDVTGGIEEDVPWFQVTMNHALHVEVEKKIKCSISTIMLL